jgi:hypothetical protein
MFETTDWGVLKPGDEVKIVRQTDELTKALVVHGFTPTFTSLEADMVGGTADPGANMALFVMADGTIPVVRFETADTNGYWLADFSAPGDDRYEESNLNITCDTVGFVAQFDNDLDISIAFWSPTATSRLISLVW